MCAWTQGPHHRPLSHSLWVWVGGESPALTQCLSPVPLVVLYKKVAAMLPILQVGKLRHRLAQAGTGAVAELGLESTSPSPSRALISCQHCLLCRASLAQGL